MRKLQIIALSLFLAGCSSVAAELERPDDVAMIRGTYIKVGIIQEMIAGGVDVCEVSALEDDAALIADYAVILDDNGCTIMPREFFSNE